MSFALQNSKGNLPIKPMREPPVFFRIQRYTALGLVGLVMIALYDQCSSQGWSSNGLVFDSDFPLIALIYAYLPYRPDRKLLATSIL